MTAPTDDNLKRAVALMWSLVNDTEHSPEYARDLLIEALSDAEQRGREAGIRECATILVDPKRQNAWSAASIRKAWSERLLALLDGGDDEAK